MAPVVMAASAPGATGATATGLTNPALVSTAIQTLEDILDPNPTPSTIGGAIWGIGKDLYDRK